MEDNFPLGQVAEDIAEDQFEEAFGLFCNKNSNAKNSVDNSANELTEFIEYLTQDVQEPAQEEIDSGIEKILKKVHQTDERKETERNNIKKKITLKVLFVAAMLSIFSISCLCVVGTNNNISIENGFVTFAKDTVRVVFFGEEEQYISAETLLIDLENNGFEDVLFPGEILTNQDKYKISVPQYVYTDVKQVAFDVFCEEITYNFILNKVDISQQEFDYVDINNAETIVITDTYAYILYHENATLAQFVYNGCRYFISTNATNSNMKKLLESIK